MGYYQVISWRQVDQILDCFSSPPVKVPIAFTRFTDGIIRGHDFWERVFFGCLFKGETSQDTIINLLPPGIEIDRER